MTARSQCSTHESQNILLETIRKVDTVSEEQNKEIGKAAEGLV